MPLTRIFAQARTSTARSVLNRLSGRQKCCSSGMASPRPRILPTLSPSWTEGVTTALPRTGAEQAHRVADRLATTRVDAIYVTSLRRTAETAAPLAARLGLAPTVEPALAEVNLGEWEGGVYRHGWPRATPSCSRWSSRNAGTSSQVPSPTTGSRPVCGPAIERIVASHPGEPGRLLRSWRDHWRRPGDGDRITPFRLHRL